MSIATLPKIHFLFDDLSGCLITLWAKIEIYTESIYPEEFSRGANLP
jgi:hypothetical protein